MSPSSRRSRKGPAKSPPNKTAGPDPPPDRPYLRFYHSQDLRVKTLSVLTRIEEGQDARGDREILSDVIMELNSAGMEYYYLRPLGLAQVSPRLEKSARLGIGGVVLVMAPVVRAVIRRMDRREILAVCRHIRELME